MRWSRLTPNERMLPLYLWHALADERARQDAKWGWTENHRCAMAHGTDDRRLSILLEEVGEVAIALNEHEDRGALHAELIQVAAVAVAWVQADKELGRT